MIFKMMTPRSTEELLEIVATCQGRAFRFGAGYTDLMLELKKAEGPMPRVINLAHIQDPRFGAVQETPNRIRIGALVTIAELAEHRATATHFPVLQQAARQLGSPQVRNVATVGGNLCTASPAGDVACALTALDAQCEILSVSGPIRSVPVKDFFTGLRTTVLGPDELLRNVSIDKRPGTVLSHYTKVGTRRSMECSIVSMACHLVLDEQGSVSSAGVALGSVAPTIRFAGAACDHLLGAGPDTVGSAFLTTFTEKVMACASPISDLRAGAWYRRKVLRNLCATVFQG